MLNKYSLQYFPVSCDNWVSIEACGADLDRGGPWVEQTANDNCIVGEILRRNSAYRVVGDGRWSEAWRRVAFPCAASCVVGSSLRFEDPERARSFNPGMLTPSKIESHLQSCTGATGAMGA